jgi:uncharacterized SAM-binding protein YcdF (DUF218 family)
VGICLGVIAVACAALLGLAWRIDSYGQVEGAVPADALVVLGARVLPGGEPDDSLRVRTLKAVRLYQEGIAPYVICTGGVGDNPPAESRVAADLAITCGVPAEKVLLEEHSTSTRENAEYAARICRERGWKRVVVVSDPYHLYRARRAFEREGLTVSTSPARACRRNRSPRLRVFWTLRETLLVLREMVM